MVTFAPGGLAGLIDGARADRARWPAWPTAGAVSTPARSRRSSTLIGFVRRRRAGSFLTIGAAQGKHLALFGVTIDAARSLPGLVAAVLLVGGGALAAPGDRARSRGSGTDVTAESEGGGSADDGTHRPSRLSDVRKSFGRREIIRGVDLAVAPGERARHHRPERRRQVHAVQPDQRPLPDHVRRRSC